MDRGAGSQPAPMARWSCKTIHKQPRASSTQHSKLHPLYNTWRPWPTVAVGGQTKVPCSPVLPQPSWQPSPACKGRDLAARRIWQDPSSSSLHLLARLLQSNKGAGGAPFWATHCFIQMYHACSRCRGHLSFKPQEVSTATSQHSQHHITNLCTQQHTGCRNMTPHTPTVALYGLGRVLCSQVLPQLSWQTSPALTCFDIYQEDMAGPEQQPPPVALTCCSDVRTGCTHAHKKGSCVHTITNQPPCHAAPNRRQLRHTPQYTRTWLAVYVPACSNTQQRCMQGAAPCTSKGGLYIDAKPAMSMHLHAAAVVSNHVGELQPLQKRDKTSRPTRAHFTAGHSLQHMITQASCHKQPLCKQERAPSSQVPSQSSLQSPSGQEPKDAARKLWQHLSTSTPPNHPALAHQWCWLLVTNIKG
jgi:hypothetical protein